MSEPPPTQHIPEKPGINCLLLCEDVFESKAGGQKHHLKGVINAYHTPIIPVTVGPPVCYVRMMDLRPGTEVALVINHHDDPSDVVIEIRTKIGDGAEALGMYTFIVPMPPLTFKQQGRYDLSVQHKGVAEVVSPIEVVLVKPRLAPEDPVE